MLPVQPAYKGKYQREEDHRGDVDNERLYSVIRVHITVGYDKYRCGSDDKSSSKRVIEFRMTHLLLRMTDGRSRKE